MKKLFVLFVLFTSLAFSQQLVRVTFNNVLEAQQQTGYVSLGEWSRIDSIGLTLAGRGEIDIDSVDVYPGYKLPSGQGYYFGTAYTFLADPNIAASTDFWTNGVGATADKDAPTVLTSAVMRGGINSLQVKVRGADGSESGNTLHCIFRIWGTK